MESGVTKEGVEKQNDPTMLALESLDSDMKLRKDASKHSLEIDRKDDVNAVVPHKVKPPRPSTAGRQPTNTNVL